MKYFSEAQILLLKQDNRQQQKQTFEALYAPLFRVCLRYLGNREEAEDCLLQGFMKGFQMMHKFEYRTESSLFWWMRQIMINECLMVLRKRHNFHLTLDEEVYLVAEDPLVWEKLAADDLQNMVMRLSTGYRTVFNLFVVEGFEHKEIAELLGISEGTSKSQLAKAKGKLRQLLEQMQYSYGNTGK
jgi:RNA polymerase sigma-70 factor (ECF subfamily)